MATCKLGDIFQDVRGWLNDTGFQGSVPTGEDFTNSVLPIYFGEPYRSMFSRLQGASKQVQNIVEIVVPSYSTVVIPKNYGIEDFSDPEMIEERSSGLGLEITSTVVSTPIQVIMSQPHGYTIGSFIEGSIQGVVGTLAPWGHWFGQVVNTTSFLLNGSASDGLAGTGGFWHPTPGTNYTEVRSIDLAYQGLDGPPGPNFGVFLWGNGVLRLRASSNNIELRLTYYASGAPPSNPNYIIQIDGCRDFLSKATAANAAASRNWTSRAQELRNEAYGDPSHPETPSLLDLFVSSQVLAQQRGPIRRQLPFRTKRSRFGNYLLG